MTAKTAERHQLKGATPGKGRGHQGQRKKKGTTPREGQGRHGQREERKEAPRGGQGRQQQRERKDATPRTGRCTQEQHIEGAEAHHQEKAKAVKQREKKDGVASAQ